MKQHTPSSNPGGGMLTAFQPARWFRLLHATALHWGSNGLLASVALVWALIVDGACHSALWAQGSGNPPAGPLRLTVLPHKMVLGTRTAKAGQYALDTLGNSVYIPPKAVGKRRVPLVLSFSGDAVERWRPMVDRYGMIYVTLSGSWGEIAQNGGMKDIDALLQKVLSTYAIDLDKIALLGMSNGGNLAVLIGCQNLNVFSRIGLVSPIPGEYPSCADTTRSLVARTQFFLTMGIGESNGVLREIVRMVPEVRHDGHPLQFGLNLRFHESRRKDYGNLWQWLADSWASPKTTARPAPPTRGGDVIPLTIDALAKMTTFWESFRGNHPMVDPQILHDEWPTVNEKLVTITVGKERATVYDMIDLRAIAAKDKSVAIALKKAGLTFQQEEGYRAAFLGARATMLARPLDQGLDIIPTVEQNVKFLQEHQTDVDAFLDVMGTPRCEISRQEQFQPGSCGA